MFTKNTNSSILDVGCGTGCHSIELAKRGYVVMGLDLSSEMLSRATDAAKSAGVNVNRVRSDAAQFSLPSIQKFRTHIQRLSWRERMSIEGYSIRRAAEDEIGILISWANAEGWNPGIYDAETFYRTDPYGFFVGLLDGEPVSSISAVAYGDSFGFLGFYIVKPQFRGRGLGIAIWNAGMEYLKGRNIGLDGVLAQQKQYERDGFFPCYKSVRHEGVGTGRASNDKSIKSLSEVPIEDLLAYDDRYFPVPRHAFTKSWIRQPGGVALAATNDGELEGYGVIRKCHLGYKIGPLFAEDEMVADRLFCSLCCHASEGAPVFLDTPVPNSLALDLAKRHHMHPVFETVRMYSEEDPALPIEGIFGVTSFELG